MSDNGQQHDKQGKHDKGQAWPRRGQGYTAAIVGFLPWAEDGQTLTALSLSERFIFAAYEVPRNIFASKVYGGLLLQA